MSRANPSMATLHVGVALLQCESSIILEETLLMLANLPIHTLRVGDSALAFPAHQFHLVQDALESQQCFPTVVGPPRHALPGD